MSNSLSVIRVEGNLGASLGARKTRGNLPLLLFGDALRHLQFRVAGAQKVITNTLQLLYFRIYSTP